MSFQQVFYTSCEKGVGARKGFQVKACSPGIPSSTLEKVERLGLYERPLSTPGRPSPEEIKLFPISLFFQNLNDGSAVLGQAKYIGVDYTNRPGNFFAHSLVSTSSYKDFCQISKILPIETWMATYWVSSENNTTEIPVIEKILPGDRIEFLNIQPFLNKSGYKKFLPSFLTAVVESLKSNRRIIIVDDNENIAFWIAVASYVLPYHLVLNLTFNTYVQNPYHNESLITGTTEDSSFNFAPHEIDHQYFVFDFKGDRFTKIEPNGFAVKCSFLYEQPKDEVIAGFAPFIEQVAPELPIDELEDAFSAYCYLENINLPDVNNVNVLTWCTKYLECLADKDFRSLFDKVVNERPIKNETLQACTNFYLAALNSEINPPAINQIENLYIRWLICDAIPTAEIDALVETGENLPHHNYTGEHLEKVFKEWLKNLKETANLSQFIAILQIGNKLGFLKNENDILRWLGRNAVGKWIVDSEIKQIVKELSSQSGGISLLEGVGTFLAENIDNLPLFSSIADLITDASCYHILTRYAVKAENLLLYIRIDGIRINLLSEHSDRLQILNEQLANIRRDFDTDITSEVVQALFNSVWLNRNPTLSEANRLFLPPLREFVIRSEIPSALVDSLSLEISNFDEGQQKKLIDNLSADDVYESLGEKNFLLQAHRIALDLRSDFIDPDGEKIKTHLLWIAKHDAHISGISPILEERLAYSLFNVKKIESHSRLLLDCFGKNRTNFLKAYNAKVERILRESENLSEIVRLLRTWIISAQSNERFLNTQFPVWSEILLKNQSKRNIEKIENNLKQVDPKSFNFWLAVKEVFEKNHPGFFKKVLGGFFNRQ